MGSGTYLISNYLLNNGLSPQEGASDQDWVVPSSTREVARVAYRISDSKGKGKKKPEIFKASDEKWFKESRFSVSKEALKAWKDAKTVLMAAHPEYRKLNKRAQQLCREAANYLIAYAREVTGLKNLVIVLEKLDLNNRFWAGKGRRLVGWDHFGDPKQEGRWFIQRFHKVLTEQGVNHGIPVFHVTASYTSQTCPMDGCHHCSKESRSSENRGIFRCVACGVPNHADLDVATHNIARVALQGHALPGPVKEKKSKRSSAPKKAGTARTAKLKVKAHPPEYISDQAPAPTLTVPQDLSQTGV
jgi:transposase